MSKIKRSAAMKCGRCAYYDTDVSITPMDREPVVMLHPCRRYPSAELVLVWSYDWCGEFKRNEEPDPA